jgi:adenosylcobinamide-phosphate synthase
MEHTTTVIVPLTVGFILDLVLGDPIWLPHPVRLFGNLISRGDGIFNRGNYRFVKGALFSGFMIMGCWLAFWLLTCVLQPYSNFYLFILSISVFYGLANRNLIEEVWKVNQVLTKEGLKAGRNQLSRIVGRQTSNLNENQIRTASLETLAENLSDGVIAPLFYYALGGVPMMFAYKMVNTLDSMIGYKNERYALFGKFAARTDDVLNFIPSRITALLMVLVAFSPRGLIFIFRYGHKHASPNSGYPEAALAGILDCRFGGANVYHGVEVKKPYIGETVRDITQAMIVKACLVNIGTVLLFGALLGWMLVCN